MKFMVRWTVRPGKLQEAVDRFLKYGDPLPATMKSLGRWHRTDMSGGVHLVESDNASAIAEYAAGWADVLELETSMVVEDADAISAYSRIPGVGGQTKPKAAGGNES